MSGERFIEIQLAQDDRHLIQRVWKGIQAMDRDAPDLVWRDWWPSGPSLTWRDWQPPRPARPKDLRHVEWYVSPPLFYRKCPLTAQRLAKMFSRIGAYGRVSVEPCQHCDQRDPPHHLCCSPHTRYLVFNPVIESRRRLPDHARFLRQWEKGIHV